MLVLQGVQLVNMGMPDLETHNPLGSVDRPAYRRTPVSSTTVEIHFLVRRGYLYLKTPVIRNFLDRGVVDIFDLPVIRPKVAARDTRELPMMLTRRRSPSP